MSCQLIRFTVSEKRKLEKDNSWCITRKTAGLNKVVWLRIEQEGFEKETKALKLCDFCRDGTMYGSLWHSFIACWYLGLLLQSFSIAKFETSLLCGMLIDFVDNRLEVQRKYIKESPYLAWSMVNTKTHREIRKLLLLLCSIVKSEILTALFMKIQVFWKVTTSRLVRVYCLFCPPCWFHFKRPSNRRV